MFNFQAKRAWKKDCHSQKFVRQSAYSSFPALSRNMTEELASAKVTATLPPSVSYWRTFSTLPPAVALIAMSGGGLIDITDPSAKMSICTG